MKTRQVGVLCLQFVIVALLACSGPAHAKQGSLESEDVSPGMRINGVPLHVVRLTGVGVADYARELQRNWYPAPQAGSPWAQVGGWRVLSRRVGRWSEVLQVRQGASPEEALLSRIDTGRQPVPVRRLMLELPAACHVTSTVEFAADTDRRMQVSARCAARPEQVIAAVQSVAGVAGWHQDAQSGASVQRLTRGTTQLTVLIGGDGEGPAREASWLVAVERTSPDASP